MADNPAVPTVDPAAGPPPAPAPAAAPRIDISTGRNKMSQFAATLVSNRTINVEQNGLNYPFHYHKLNAETCLTLFLNILTPMVFSMYRILGASNLGNANDLASLRTTARTVAYTCLEALYNQIYSKAFRVTSAAITLFGSPATVLTQEFPVFIAALITSAGPVQFNDIPSRGIHIPYLDYTEVQALVPAPFETYRVGMFHEALARSREFATSTVDPHTNTSSAWWTFHTWIERARNDAVTYSLWSPVKSTDTDDALKLGCLYAKSKLTVGPGVVNFSSTPFYDINDPPRTALLPAAAMEFPHFVESQPAYYRFLQRDPDNNDPTVTPVSPTTGSASLPAAESSSAASAANRSAERTTKKRKLPDGSNVSTDETNPLHRAIYYYYDHRVGQNFNSRQLDAWALELNKQ